MTPEVEARLEQQELRIENNIMIMTFMGVKPDRVRDTYYSWSDQPYFYTNNTDEQQILRDMAEYLKYDSDWNLIMAVVVKCFDTEEMGDFDDFHKDINEALLMTDIKILYKTVLSFVRKYYDHLYQESLKQDEQRYEDAKR